MAWNYDETDLTTDTASGRVNSVRLLVGDTDTNDQQVQDEEITFALEQTGNDIYSAASWIAATLASKYSRKVTTELDSAIKAEYSDLSKNYRLLSVTLKQDARRFSGTGLNAFGGCL